MLVVSMEVKGGGRGGASPARSVTPTSPSTSTLLDMIDRADVAELHGFLVSLSPDGIKFIFILQMDPTSSRE